MAVSRSSSRFVDVGNKPPFVSWTFVRGDTAAFRVFAVDDAKQPLVIQDWSIDMKIKRPNTSLSLGDISDDATLIMNLTPSVTPDDGPGEFTVSITADQSQVLETGDIFDIQLSLPQDAKVWTVAQGSVIVLEDVTD
jgi:hypothetical protein